MTTAAIPDLPPGNPTFVCRDCGMPVFDALGEVRERCHPCQWVANISDPAERADLRAKLERLGVIDRRASE
jgi:hypothetical protein